jgi:exodeoxyribonuclease III
MKIASWNVNSIRARLDHVTTWLKARKPDVLLLQELKGTEFPATVFEDLGYASVAVTQKAYNGVAILSRHPIETISTTLAGDEADMRGIWKRRSWASASSIFIFPMAIR